MDEFESKDIVRGTAKAGRVFYSSRDMYRLRGILLFISRGLTLEEAQQRVDLPADGDVLLEMVDRARGQG